MVAYTGTTEAKKTLTSKQVEAAQMLAEGTTAIAAAERLGIGRRTLQRWKSDDTFQAAIREMENAYYDEALRMLKRASRMAISCLLRNMDGKVSPYVQVQAAAKVLDASIEIHKIAEVEAKLVELNKVVEQVKGNRHGRY